MIVVYRLLRYLSLLIVLTIVGCTVDPVKKDPDEIDFNNLNGHWASFHVYEMGRRFSEVDIDLALKAARAGLSYADFEIFDTNALNYHVSGKRDWKGEIVGLAPVGASVYLSEEESNVVVKVFYKLHDLEYGLKWEDSPGTEAIRKDISNIFKGMNNFLIEEKIKIQQARED